MKYLSFITVTLSAAVFSIAAPAHANNSAIENALKNRSDLSIFYESLRNTGVMDELKEGESYTVFAPTNEAFAKYPPEQYPCLYSQRCKAQAADIVRDHIVPGRKLLSDVDSQKGEIMSMFAINKHHITGSEPSKDNYAVDGQNILSEKDLSGSSILYSVSGLVSSEKEMAQFTSPTTTVAIVHPPGYLPPRVPEGRIVTLPADADDLPSASPAR